ncbi:lysosome-associated membrane glycoprotein 3 [Melopsittacus undulatus]|uniref:Lysosome-associated membrane glycoprotein 2-like luminal domain-containing protein n=1 Tax=Melopsittacus undulatus TaxID=13146 RepID=A0A8C6J9V8_MELUD|nr:lysosome-associated membrane glycoprotein 3 [Melopsittacus undulatus]XP_030902996.1 lysosome-associated membrane glycoprotein 3 [Melopsittacus undulatus]
MGRSTWQFILLTTCAFSSCFAEVALGVKVSPETISFTHTTTSQPHPRHHSSSHQGTTVHFNSTGSLKTTSTSHRTTVQTTDQHQVTTAPGHHMTDQAAATTTQVISRKSPMMVSAISSDNTTAAGQTTTQAMETVTLVVNNATIHPVSFTKQDRACVSAEITAAATNTTIKHTTPNTQMTATAINTTATTMQTVQPTTGSGNQTTLPESSIAPAMTNATTIHPGTQTAIPSTMMTARPTLAPQPSPIPTGTYTISSGNRTCIKAVMGLQLMAQNAQKQMKYMTVNPNVTQTFGSCGMVQSELNITFSGGFVNFTFVKQAPSYYVSKIETRLQLSSEGMLYCGAVQEKMFTTKLGNSFKCASKQTFNLEKNFQLLFVNMQLQAFDIVGNQFGKEEECFPDKNSKAAPIAVGLSILGLLVIMFATFLISRRKPQRGYERI